MSDSGRAEPPVGRLSLDIVAAMPLDVDPHSAGDVKDAGLLNTLDGMPDEANFVHPSTAVKTATDEQPLLTAPLKSTNGDKLGMLANAATATTKSHLHTHLSHLIAAQRARQTMASSPTWKRLIASNRRIVHQTTTVEHLPSYVDCRWQPTSSTDRREEVQVRLTKHLRRQRKQMSIKVARLRDTYRRLHKQWRMHCDRLDHIEEQAEADRRPFYFGGSAAQQSQLPTATPNERLPADNLGAAASVGGSVPAVTSAVEAEVDQTDVQQQAISSAQEATATEADAHPATAMDGVDMPLVSATTTAPASAVAPAPAHTRNVSMDEPLTTGGLLASTPKATMTRSNRRNTHGGGLVGFGDAVRSEAEFLEILATLESADMQDPSIRAARTTAVEPEMTISASLDDDDFDIDTDPPSSIKAAGLVRGTLGDAMGKQAQKRDFDDDNGFVADPIAFYLSDFDPDVWTSEEKTIFARRYALFPKQFGKIAASLPDKTANQCVSYYYLTKKLDGHDYKALLASRNRDRRRKPRLVKPKKGRGSALMADLKAADEGGDDDDERSPLDVYGAGGMMITGRRQSARASRTMSTNIGNQSLGTPTDERGMPFVDASEERAALASLDGTLADRGSGGGAKRGRAGRGGANPTARRTAASSAAAARGDRKGGQQASTNSAEQDASTSGPSLATVKKRRGQSALSRSLQGVASSSGELAAGGVSAEAMIPPVVGGAGDAADAAMIEGFGVGASDTTSKRGRQTTSSYWSVAERNEFLRWLAIAGKDWDAIALNLPTKSAAQARNYFARNASEADFVEAVDLALASVDRPYEERKEAADNLIRRRTAASANISGLTSPTHQARGQPADRQATVDFRQDGPLTENAAAKAEPMSGYFAAHPSPPRPADEMRSREEIAPMRGLNINELLNADSQPTSRRTWFANPGQGREEGEADDETEDEGDEPIGPGVSGDRVGSVRLLSSEMRGDAVREARDEARAVADERWAGGRSVMQDARSSASPAPPSWNQGHRMRPMPPPLTTYLPASSSRRQTDDARYRNGATGPPFQQQQQQHHHWPPRTPPTAGPYGGEMMSDARGAIRGGYVGPPSFERTPDPYSSHFHSRALPPPPPSQPPSFFSHRHHHIRPPSPPHFPARHPRPPNLPPSNPALFRQHDQEREHYYRQQRGFQR